MITLNASLLAKSIGMGFVIGLILYALAAPQTIHADLNNTVNDTSSATLIKDGHLTICKLDKSDVEVVRKMKVMVTAYSSTPDQTDDTPEITASGKHVEDGIIAINGLKFGTKVRIPKLFGDKIFVVQDRMNARKGNYHVDIWMTSRKEAVNFGAKITDIEIVES